MTEDFRCEARDVKDYSRPSEVYLPSLIQHAEKETQRLLWDSQPYPGYLPHLSTTPAHKVFLMRESIGALERLLERGRRSVQEVSQLAAG